MNTNTFYFKRWQVLCVNLLAHKFRYYCLNAPTISDTEYDILEQQWMALGRKVGRTRVPPFWIGFDLHHPFAEQARAKTLPRLS